MKYTIDCSFGEIVDKITILQIKLKKVTNAAQRANILAEYNALEKYIHTDNAFVTLFDKLSKINNKLWILEDIIRQKSAKKEFDAQYIKCSEGIHTTNDERYAVKRQLTELYDSEIVEEKLYMRNEDHSRTYKQALQYYEENRLEDARFQIETLCEIYRSKQVTLFTYHVFFSHEVVASALGIDNRYTSKMHDLAQGISTYITNPEYAIYCKKLYGMMMLRQKKYLTPDCIRYINPVTVDALGIRPETMSYFAKGETGKTLLIYMGGGLGDKIMFARFIRKVCETQPANRVIFLVDDCLEWMFVHNQPNLTILRFSQRGLLPPFDYHTNVAMLFVWLGLDYSDIYADAYLAPLVSNTANIAEIIDTTRRNIVINWHGSYANPLEKTNRGISLSAFVPFLNMTNIHWISLQKEVSPEEEQLLRAHNVTHLGPTVDNDGHAFRDTLSILRNVDLVISTDTSLVHVAGTANIPCWVLLTKGCEWRWTQDVTTHWYPKLTLIRQERVSDWSTVISRVCRDLSAENVANE